MRAKKADIIFRGPVIYSICPSYKDNTKGFLKSYYSSIFLLLHISIRLSIFVFTSVIVHFLCFFCNKDRIKSIFPFNFPISCSICLYSEDSQYVGSVNWGNPVPCVFSIFDLNTLIVRHQLKLFFYF